MNPKSGNGKYPRPKMYNLYMDRTCMTSNMVQRSLACWGPGAANQRCDERSRYRNQLCAPRIKNLMAGRGGRSMNKIVMRAERERIMEERLKDVNMHMYVVVSAFQPNLIMLRTLYRNPRLCLWRSCSRNAEPYMIIHKHRNRQAQTHKSEA